jgi:hypothetical protein
MAHKASQPEAMVLFRRLAAFSSRPPRPPKRRHSVSMSGLALSGSPFPVRPASIGVPSRVDTIDDAVAVVIRTGSRPSPTAAWMRFVR